MTRRLRVTVLATLASLAAAVPAQAQPDGGATVLLGGVPLVDGHVSTQVVNLAVSGEIAVSFAADQRSGCSALSACGYQGTVIWKPTSAQVVAERYTLHGKRYLTASMSFDVASSGQSSVHYARVVRRPAGGTTTVCADGLPGIGDVLTAHITSGTFRFGLAEAMASTRCAGPLPGDLTAAVPDLVLPVHATRGTRIAASGTRSFASHGFAGAVASTLTFRVGASSTQGPGLVPRGLHQQRLRVVTESVRIIAARGSITEDVRGTSAAEGCILLDSCGLTGVITVTPAAGRTEAGDLSAFGPVSIPYREFLADLGRRAGRRTGGTEATGEVAWDDRGTLHADLHQGVTCSDTAALGAGSAILVVVGPRIEAVYSPSATGGLASRTRCPGPQPRGAVSLTGSAPLGALSGGAFTIVVRARGAFADDGYTVAPHGRVALTFKLGRVSQRVLSGVAP